MKTKITKKRILTIVGISLSSLILLLVGILFYVKTSAQGVILAKEQNTISEIERIPEITMSPQPNEEIGVFYFPKVDLKVPIVYGYNADFMDQYFDVIGLESWNNFPGQNNKLYLNGHRHLAFQNLKYMELGDKVILYMPYGEFTYEVNRDPQIVLANDKEAVAFYLQERDKEFTPQILRLQTCYPFEAGSTLDHRYLVDLTLVESKMYRNIKA